MTTYTVHIARDDTGPDGEAAGRHDGEVTLRVDVHQGRAEVTGLTVSYPGRHGGAAPPINPRKLVDAVFASARGSTPHWMDNDRPAPVRRPGRSRLGKRERGHR